MLVLTRKPQETIRIGDGITITVIKTKGQGVRLGIEAPADVSVLRGELLAARDSFATKVSDAASSDTLGAEPAEANATPPKTPRSEPQVSHTRVKRSRVPSVLPDLLGEPGPLRAMMQGRASTGV
ncbi:Carbon storage regulator [Botrimarina colliarenosi]|uniref:Translational regulator CsrA n=1 Tax=Botrimarina colliarenosi TaxID=2528001 RepID=A0A5C6A2C0_9BACT|nr:carbon storage regulator [Botrimarina colliarenosi]TWT93480.1 Carbon storage regulator [Botrimarina colliarenosi]